MITSPGNPTAGQKAKAKAKDFATAKKALMVLVTQGIKDLRNDPVFAQAKVVPADRRAGGAKRELVVTGNTANHTRRLAALGRLRDRLSALKDEELDVGKLPGARITLSDIRADKHTAGVLPLKYANFDFQIRVASPYSQLGGGGVGKVEPMLPREFGLTSGGLTYPEYTRKIAATLTSPKLYPIDDEVRTLLGKLFLQVTGGGVSKAAIHPQGAIDPSDGLLSVLAPVIEKQFGEVLGPALAWGLNKDPRAVVDTIRFPAGQTTAGYDFQVTFLHRNIPQTVTYSAKAGSSTIPNTIKSETLVPNIRNQRLDEIQLGKRRSGVVLRKAEILKSVEFKVLEALHASGTRTGPLAAVVYSGLLPVLKTRYKDELNPIWVEDNFKRLNTFLFNRGLVNEQYQPKKDLQQAVKKNTTATMLLQAHPPTRMDKTPDQAAIKLLLDLSRSNSTSTGDMRLYRQTQQRLNYLPILLFATWGQLAFIKFTMTRSGQYSTQLVGKGSFKEIENRNVFLRTKGTDSAGLTSSEKLGITPP